MEKINSLILKFESFEEEVGFIIENKKNQIQYVDFQKYLELKEKFKKLDTETIKKFEKLDQLITGYALENIENIENIEHIKKSLNSLNEKSEKIKKVKENIENIIKEIFPKYSLEEMPKTFLIKKPNPIKLKKNKSEPCIKKRESKLCEESKSAPLLMGIPKPKLNTNSSKIKL